MLLAVPVAERPCFDDAEIHERGSAQVAVECDVLIGLAADRRGKESNLVEHVREVAAAARERQLQRCGSVRPSTGSPTRHRSRRRCGQSARSTSAT
jgi:hypothetical protein